MAHPHKKAPSVPVTNGAPGSAVAAKVQKKNFEDRVTFICMQQADKAADSTNSEKTRTS